MKTRTLWTILETNRDFGAHDAAVFRKAYATQDEAVLAVHQHLLETAQGRWEKDLDTMGLWANPQEASDDVEWNDERSHAICEWYDEAAAWTIAEVEVPTGI